MENTFELKIDPIQRKAISYMIKAAQFSFINRKRLIIQNHIETALTLMKDGRSDEDIMTIVGLDKAQMAVIELHFVKRDGTIKKRIHKKTKSKAIDYFLAIERYRFQNALGSRGFDCFKKVNE